MRTRLIRALALFGIVGTLLMVGTAPWVLPDASPPGGDSVIVTTIL